MVMMRRVRGVVVVAMAGLVFGGCLEVGRRRAFLKYDEGADTFGVLRVYTHIKGKTPGDRAYLAAMWKNREQLLPGDVVGILAERVYFRADGKHFYDLSLGEAGAKQEPQESPIDLAGIVNKPGRFFLSGEGTLCYYHQMELPGATLDAGIGSLCVATDPEIAKKIEEEMDWRNKGGSGTTWEDLRASLRREKQMTAGHLPVDDETLKLNLAAARAGEKWIERKGAVVSVHGYLSDADEKEFRATLAVLKEQATKDVADKGLDENSRKWARATLDVLGAVMIETGKDHRVTLSVDLRDGEKILEQYVNEEGIGGEMDKKETAAYDATVAAVREAGAKIDEELKLEEVLERFKKGTLPVDLPVEKGEGVGVLFKEGK